MIYRVAEKTLRSRFGNISVPLPFSNSKTNTTNVISSIDKTAIEIFVIFIVKIIKGAGQF